MEKIELFKYKSLIITSKSGEIAMQYQKILKTSPIAIVALLTSISFAANGQNMAGSFDGWHQVGNANWRIEQGEFVSDEGNGHLVTDRSYLDFRITAEFFVDAPTANSGIYFRITDENTIRDTTAYEANINDERPDMEKSTGALVNHVPPGEFIKTAGQWNTYEVTAQGDHIVIVLNGITTVDTHNTTHTNSGPVSLQHLAGEVRFRNVMIEAL